MALFSSFPACEKKGHDFPSMTFQLAGFARIK